MLLVDDGQAQALEFDVGFEQRVRSYDDMRQAGGG